MQLFDVIDFERLPADTQPVARLLVDGYSQKQIAGLLEPPRSHEYVSGVVRALRDAMIEQGLARVDDLDARLRALLVQLKTN